MLINIKLEQIRSMAQTEPVITVKKGRENTYCHEVEVLDPSTIMYSGNDKPILLCARVVIMTESEVNY